MRTSGLLPAPGPMRTAGLLPAPGLRLALAAAIAILVAAPVLIVTTALTAAPAVACNENTMLDFIGSLEAPGGYDTVYYGVRVEPPRPITTMSISEVLDWQRRAVRGGSVSSAAGRYQIIRPTLARLVDTGVVSPHETFDMATQDRLGRHLLRETGYRAGDTSAATANRIAGVWAALPRIGGPGEGSSVYEGIAGNHALVRAQTYQGVLECRIAVADTELEAMVVREGERFGFNWDRFIGELAAAGERAAAGLAQGATGLLIILFTVDLVWRGGRWTLTGTGPGFLAALTSRLLAVLMCMALIAAAGPTIAFIGELAARLAGHAGGGPPFSMARFAASKMALAFSLFESFGSVTFEIKAMIATVALIIVLLAGMQMAVVIFWYVRLFLAAAAGIPVIGFGGLTQGMAAAQAWMFSLMASGMSLMALLLVLAVTTLLTWDLRSTTDPATAALVLVFMEAVALALVFLLPKTAGAIIAGGRTGMP